MRSIVLLGVLCAVGCQKSDANGNAAPSASAQTTQTASVAASASSAPTVAAAGPHKVADIGDVPAWSADATTGGAKCTVDAASKAVIQPLSQGKDKTLSDGTADVNAMIAKTNAATCVATRKDLVNALNDGGYERYKAKSYTEADRWWRAALVARPSATTPRYNLACGLALEGKGKDAVWAIQEIARAAADGDASAVNFLEKAKSDADLVSVRDDADFKTAIAVASTAGGVLVGPRKEPETSVAAVKLLPGEFKKTKDNIGYTADGWITYSPALVHVWTWRPDASSELVVATIVDDPAKLGKPKGDMNQDYGGIGVFQRDAGTLKLLFAHKTGESPPSVAAKNKDVAYSFDTMCGTINGTLAWKDAKVVMKEQPCSN
jgi:hypothetical protein